MSVRMEFRARGPPTVAQRRRGKLFILNRPNTHTAIELTRHQATTIRAEYGSHDNRFIAQDTADQMSCLHIPQLESAASSGAGQQFPIRAERHMIHHRSVVERWKYLTPRRRAPKMNRI